MHTNIFLDERICNLMQSSFRFASKKSRGLLEKNKYGQNNVIRMQVMQDSQILLSEKINLLYNLGLPKNIATVIVFLHENGKCISQQIEQKTGLRQPEVSIAMKELAEKGWLGKEVSRRKRKGRPIYQYYLAVPPKTIISTLRAEHEKRIAQIEEIFKKLEKMFD